MNTNPNPPRFMRGNNHFLRLTDGRTKVRRWILIDGDWLSFLLEQEPNDEGVIPFAYTEIEPLPTVYNKTLSPVVPLAIEKWVRTHWSPGSDLYRDQRFFIKRYPIGFYLLPDGGLPNRILSENRSRFVKIENLAPLSDFIK